MVVGDPDQQLFALPNGGTTTFTTTTPTKCTIIDSNMLHAVALGECVVVASNPGDSYYLPASPVSQTINITASITDLNKTLLWADEFNGAANTGPDAASWSATQGDGCGTSAGCGWGNGEAESYAECANRQDGNGVMVITASTPTGDSSCTSNKTWTSGKFTTYGKQNFTYGYFEARLKMPEGGGTWPAFWTLGSNINSVQWPRCGELDIMEYAGNNSTRTTSAAHYANSSGAHDYKSSGLNNSTDLFDEYHTYGLLWLPNEITFLFDGRPVLILKKADTGLTRWPFGPNAAGVDPKMYLIFNLAMGGGYGGDIQGGLKKATYSIDYVRYYSVDGFGAVSTN
jgi:beta-glucanase (GH16 family)